MVSLSQTRTLQTPFSRKKEYTRKNKYQGELAMVEDG